MNKGKKEGVQENITAHAIGLALQMPWNQPWHVKRSREFMMMEQRYIRIYEFRYTTLQHIKLHKVPLLLIGHKICP